MSRRLAELRVPELRAELERRNKERTGVKHVLQERLAQAITDEGHDPEEYLFEIPSEKKIPAKKTSRSGSLQGDYDETMEDVSLDNLVVKDEIMEDDVSLETETLKSVDSPIKPKTEPVDSSAAESSVSVVNEPEVKNSTVKKRELTEASDSVEAKRLCKEELKTDNAKKNIDINAMDAEDSINLDINEDEFLNEEGESGVPDKKDVTSMAQGVADTSLLKPAEENISGATKQEATDDSVQDDKQQDNSHSDVVGAVDSKMDSNLSDADKGKDDKDFKKINISSTSSRNLWVSGLSGSTSAKDLKQLCSKYGKVIGAKVVTNARTPGSRCYGYVTMASAEDANNCIKHLHRTELHGRMILMEKAKSESTNTSGYTASGNSARNGRNSSQLQRTPHRSGANREKSDDTPNTDKRKDSTSKDIKIEDESADAKSKDDESKNDADKDKKKSGSILDTSQEGRKENSKSKGTSQDRKLKEDRNRDRIRQERERHRRPPAQRDFLSFSKIRKEREAQRAREQLRRARSEERRRRAAEQSLRELERRQRAEKQRQRVEKDRLAIEREKLRIEREKIEREKHELNRLERERQKLERERLELERLELKRAQMRLEEERAKRNYLYTSTGGSSSLLSRSKQTLPPPPPYEHSAGRSATESGGNSSSARFNMSLPTHMDTVPPVYDMAPNSSSNKTSDRGPPSRDRQRDRDRRDFKRDYPPPPRHASSSHTGSVRLGGSGNGMKYQSNGTSYEPRQPLPPGTRPRDQSRYTSMDGANSRDGAGSSMRERTAGSSGHDRTSTSNTSYRPSESSRRSPKPTSRDHRYSDSAVTMKGDSWTNSGGAESSGRYGGTLASSGSQYADARYGPPYQSAPFF